MYIYIQQLHSGKFLLLRMNQLSYPHSWGFWARKINVLTAEEVGQLMGGN